MRRKVPAPEPWDLPCEDERTSLAMTLQAALRVAVASALAALGVACGSGEEPGRANDRAEVRPALATAIPVGEKSNGITGVEAGEGAVWVASAGNCSGSISRIDPDVNRVTATVPTGSVTDLAVGAGAVWAVGEVCGEGPNLFRIEPRTSKVAARIPLLSPAEARANPDVLTSGVATGEGGVWVSLSLDPRTGEVIRVDPRSNEVVGKIPTQGFAGELVVEAGGVWVLSHPEYTDETHRAASLKRIDPQADRVVATPLRNQRLALGGEVIPPVIAAGEGWIWLPATEGTYPYRSLAFRIDARNNEVTRERLSFDAFFPVDVTEDGVWFIGQDGGAILGRLNSQTLQVDATLKLGITPVSSDLDAASGAVWIGSLGKRGERGSVLRVDLR